MNRHRRFIAGAVCPRCAARDRIHVYEADGQQHRECIDCGFADVLGEVDSGVLPEGRLDSPPRRALPEGMKAVRIISFDEDGKD